MVFNFISFYYFHLKVYNGNNLKKLFLFLSFYDLFLEILANIINKISSKI